MKLTVAPVTAVMTSPFVAGHGTVTERQLLLVSLQAADGRTGYGEAAPLESYDGVSTDAVVAALDSCRPVLDAYADAMPIADVLARCAEATVVPQALAAIDLALWDLAGGRTREPVWRLLGAAAHPRPVAVNWTIAAADRSGAAQEAAQARADGYSTVKVKVAIGDDPGRLAAVRAFAGPQMAIRIDANGGWALEEAVAALRALAPAGIELCEEPVSGVAAIRSLWVQTDVPLALDESAGDPDALLRPAADAICLKIARCGGISGTIEIAARARAAGYEVYLASTLDGPLGIAAALHAAAVIKPERACGLATLGLFADRRNPLPPARGSIALPDGTGLGHGLVDWYRA
jgi:L-Ala-D/L-Glu epimerase